MRRMITAVVAILGLLLASQSIATATTKQPAATCKNYKLDLMETSLGLWLQGLSIRIKGSEKDFFKINEVTENSFDPCADLSWVILSGNETHMADANGPLPPEAAEIQTIVFFNKDKLITKADFFSAREIKDVQVKGSNATVTYSVKSGKNRSTEKVNYSFDKGKITTKAGVSDDLKPLKLDFERGTLPMGTNAIPLGNANYHPADQEFDEDLSANIDMGDDLLLCHFFVLRPTSPTSQAQKTPGCQEVADPSWPLITSEFAPDAGTDTYKNGKTNTLDIYFGSPSFVTTKYLPMGRAFYGQEKFPDDSITRIGQVFVSTHGNTVKISNNYFTVTLSEGNVTTKNEPLIKLDTSRYPKFK